MSKDQFTVAVVGATGLVGQKMIRILEERKFPVKKFVPVASERSLDKMVSFQGSQIPVRKLTPAVFSGVDFALFSAGKKVSREFAPIAAEQGVVVVDNSSAWRMEPGVPLVVPEVNPGACSNHSGIIANPNCSTIQMVLALYPLHKAFGLKRVIVSTYQAVSGSGSKAVRQLEEEITTGKSSDPYYPHSIAYNCLPHIDLFDRDGYTFEERKMMLETRKILGIPDLPITATTVRVPVKTGHSESVNVEFDRPFTIDKVIDILSNTPGIIIQDQTEKNIYPMPLNAEERDEVFVGRIRRDESIENGLNLWIVADNLRKGAATNAVQILEYLTKGN